MDITLIKSPAGNITGGIYFTYDPSDSAAYSFVALFALCTIAHFIYMFPLRSWFFVSFILGGICETFGYYGRSKCHDNVSDIGPWILQMILILGAPTFLAATVYMTLARITVALGAEEYSMISPRWLTKIYVLIDVICFISQFAGAGVQASGDATLIAMGNKVILGGLIFQIIAFCFFLFMAWRIAARFDQNQENYPGSNRYVESTWKKYFRALYAASILLIVRNLVRAVEYAQQVNSGGFTYATRNDDGSLTYIGKHTMTIGDREAYLYVFDAALMFLVVLIFLIIHPGKFIKDNRIMRAKRISNTEMEGLTK
ncbi:2d63f000-a528-4b1f-a631-a82cccd10f02 [Sclerotinia trifoliorum]|uniref:2d63f000-a528-4b1f-a631-a82cccd10f02 n=1 Tax=Sclerotinia trifoliorum TaxID=28548 RepID=A0A8H2W4I6_9HELO|nr:2d63f000-a528-4b1f-a631-a82cccd10f02 [Sclerotinia trifoliorum]